jgi:hypothetical protein
MAPKKRHGERWFKPTSYIFCQEYKTPPNDFYVPKDKILLAWSLLAVKTSQFKFLFVVKVGTVEQHTWATLMG